MYLIPSSDLKVNRKEINDLAVPGT